MRGVIKTIYMGTMCDPRKTLCPTFKGCKLGYLVFHGKKLEPRVLPWQQHSRCLSVSHMMYISGAKFEEHCSNISEIFVITYFIVEVELV